MRLQGKHISLIKVGDAYDAMYTSKEHPNGIITGYIVIGTVVNSLKQDHSLILAREEGGYFHTSPVKEINEKEKTFTTVNSVYKYEIVERLDI